MNMEPFSLNVNALYLVVPILGVYGDDCFESLAEGQRKELVD